MIYDTSVTAKDTKGKRLSMTVRTLVGKASKDLFAMENMIPALYLYIIHMFVLYKEIFQARSYIIHIRMFTCKNMSVHLLYCIQIYITSSQQHTCPLPFLSRMKYVYELTMITCTITSLYYIRLIKVDSLFYDFVRFDRIWMGARSCYDCLICLLEEWSVFSANMKSTNSRRARK